MRPPICDFCGRNFDPSEGGDTVKFADFEPLPDGMVGHPDGLLWICGEHLDAAKALSGQQSSIALEALRRA